ncbi:MAG: MCE family protein [Mycolicibacterium hassiacum]|uniref:MlaD family protein n=1 Tax=Mycolicibacterium hassiacum TaxID=46351 RepID=UPI0023F8CEC8|nr:MlaD family protein [Mycolicibacterium hassiacum]MBX5488401.1 MCE family protein [Mycolicibacterium hassiacum]
MSGSRFRRAVPALVAVGCLVTGCATNGLASLPLPAPGVGSGGYRLTAEFTNALNLPANAKVKLAGADVGQVESMVAHNYLAVTTLRIMDGVQLPVGSTAELRSATPLGDVFVALKPPADVAPGTPMLRDGDVIGKDHTKAAATVESVLASAAILVNGGAVRNFTNIVNGLGKATGDEGKAFGHLIRKTNATLAKLNARSAEISTAMTETSRLTREIAAKNDVLADVMAQARPATDTLAAHATEVADLIERFGAISELARRFPSIAGNDTSGRSVIADANTIAKAWNDVALEPNATLYSLNRLIPPFIKTMSGGAVALDASVDRLVLGHIPDIGFAGDPGLHGPKWSDWHHLVGTLQYTLFRLQERVVGRGPNVPQLPVIPSPTEPGEIIPAPAAAPTPAPDAPHGPAPDAPHGPAPEEGPR